MRDDAHPHLADRLPRAFVVGCQKSGTTWMQHLLQAHPEVCSHGEATFAAHLVLPMIQQLKAYNTQQRVGELNTFVDDEILALARESVRVLQRKWLDACDAPQRVRVIAEKTPEHAIALHVLGAVFPSMRVIHIIRDGRDGVVSGWHHNIRSKGDAFRVQFPTMKRYSRYFAEHHWVPYITRARAWGESNPGQYLELQYEHALEKPHEQAWRIFAFLGVNTEKTLIDEVVERASFKSLSGGRSSGDVDNASHFRKGQSGGWRTDLGHDSIDAFEQIGGQLLEDLGYARAERVAV